MNLFEAIKSLTPTLDLPEVVPSYLYGAFRRKSISLFNGLTDENTIVYWFQSRSFTIDLRLKSQLDTHVAERQGWVGDTVWDQQQQLLSWEVAHYANYQNHVQWPEPAKLHAIGNSILEFSPSNVYVEDWRQQVQKIVAHLDMTAADEADGDLLQRFEVSIGTEGLTKTYSTRSGETGKAFHFDHFDLLDDMHLVQHVVVDGREIDLTFVLDMYQPDYDFQHTTTTTAEAAQWLQSEQNHLLHHAAAVL